MDGRQGDYHEDDDAVAPWRGRARATKVGAPLGRRCRSAGLALCYSDVALDPPLGPHSRSAAPHPTPPSLTYSTGASLRRIEAHHRHKKTQSFHLSTLVDTFRQMWELIPVALIKDTTKNCQGEISVQ